jgi:hypothetical protein
MRTSVFLPTQSLVLASLVLFSSAAISSPRILAQPQDPQSQSVAEAARKAKEQKKTTPKDNRVITDDTILLRAASADSGAAPPSGTVINTTPVAPSAAAPGDVPAVPADTAKSGESSAPGAGATSPASTDAQKAEEQGAEIAKAKDMLAQLQSELDLLKRQLALDSESYYSNSDYTRDLAGKSKLDDLQKSIGDKQVSLQELKQHLEELMREASASPDANNAPAPPKS